LVAMIINSKFLFTMEDLIGDAKLSNEDNNSEVVAEAVV